MTSIVGRLRELASTDRGRTHWDDCWREHRECAMAEGANEIERLQDEVRRLRCLVEPVIEESTR
jgi:hypothetical protein